jgi:hypothetical protein
MLVELLLPFNVGDLGNSQRLRGPGMVQASPQQSVVSVRSRQVIKPGLMQQLFKSETLSTFFHFEHSDYRFGRAHVCSARFLDSKDKG